MTTTDEIVLQTAIGVAPTLTVADVLTWLESKPDGDEVAATREEALRRADYLHGRDKWQVVEFRKMARVVEWEMAHRWPANENHANRTDDRPHIDASTSANQEAWQRIYAVGAQRRDWILSRTEPEELTQAAIIRGEIGRPHVAHNSGEFERYTPPRILDAARACMGDIDLDPASSEVAQRTVQARGFFTLDDDGLAHDWHGRVWLNPPFKQPEIAQFTGKLLDEFHAGRVTQAIALTHNGTETKWGQRLLAQATAVCFPAGRINFHDSEGEPLKAGGALQGQMFAFLHQDGDAQRFRDTFGPIGVIL